MKCPNCNREVENDSVFCEHCGASMNSSVDNTLLNIIEVASHHPSCFAAYKARKKCYKLCKKHAYHLDDYKEYVQNLQLRNFPNEYQKSIMGGRLYLCVWWSIFIGIVAVLGWICILVDGWDEFYYWITIPATIVLLVSMWICKCCVKGYKKLTK